MDFFRSVFSGEEEAERGMALPAERNDGGAESNPGSVGGGSSAWSGFGNLVKTVASKSESVIQTYQRDLQEFRTEIRDVVKDFPFSLEAGASVAQESLEAVGQAIDDLGDTVWRGATTIIAHSKDAILSLDSSSMDSPTQSSIISSGASTRRHTRFEMKVMELQSNAGTFTEEPEDAEDFRIWSASFQIAEKEEEIASLLAEKETLEINLQKLVPADIDYETFWIRYFYKIYKLNQGEIMRADLVKRALVEEEDLSWEVDDDDYEHDGKEEQRNDNDHEDDNSNKNMNVADKMDVTEDHGWDEIEDLVDDDGKRISGSVNLRKGLSTQEDEEDLSWDVED